MSISSRLALNRLCSIRRFALLGEGLLDLRSGYHTTNAEPIERNEIRKMQIAIGIADFCSLLRKLVSQESNNSDYKDVWKIA